MGLALKRAALLRRAALPTPRERGEARHRFRRVSATTWVAEPYYRRRTARTRASVRSQSRRRLIAGFITAEGGEPPPPPPPPVVNKASVQLIGASGSASTKTVTWEVSWHQGTEYAWLWPPDGIERATSSGGNGGVGGVQRFDIEVVPDVTVFILSVGGHGTRGYEVGGQHNPGIAGGYNSGYGANHRGGNGGSGVYTEGGDGGAGGAATALYVSTITSLAAELFAGAGGGGGGGGCVKGANGEAGQPTPEGGAPTSVGANGSPSPGPGAGYGEWAGGGGGGGGSRTGDAPGGAGGIVNNGGKGGKRGKGYLAASALALSADVYDFGTYGQPNNHDGNHGLAVITWRGQQHVFQYTGADVAILLTNTGIRTVSPNPFGGWM